MANFVSVEFKEAVMEERDGAHHYSFDGQKSVGITTILNATKPVEDMKGLEEWKERENTRWKTPANYIFKTSGPIGTDTHSMCEAWLKGKSYTPKHTLSKGHFENLLPYLKKIDNVRTNESKIYSKKLGIAGTVDVVAEYDGVLSVIDFKTKRSRRDESMILTELLQATAYSIMWEEVTGEQVQQIVILISTENNLQYEFIKNPDDYKEALLERINQFYKKD